MTVALADGVIALRPLRPADAEAHKAGEDAEQIRAFEFPGPAPMDNVVAAIHRWQESWRTGGEARNFDIWLPDGVTLVGNVEVRLIGEGRVNLSYVVFPGWRRQGIATRAANPASMGVARRLGAVLVGTERSEAGGTLIVYELVLPDASAAG